MFKADMSKRRNSHTIIVEMLKQARKGVKKSSFLMSANLSFRQLKKYLDTLKQAGLIEFNHGLWRTTEKGRSIIEACEICHKLLEET
jgi:predicted transcriptional regulator